ncbi:MAG: helix-turn-helix domain-containing protein [Nanoarchaeota archaeon]|nr:helix-turn-helix domain-containing protein [Nanoarchaeota archaeon]
MKGNKLFTVQEMAEMLSVPVSWIYQRTRFGKESIPHIKLGKYIRFDPEEVIGFFKEKTPNSWDSFGA